MIIDNYNLNSQINNYTNASTTNNVATTPIPNESLSNGSKLLGNLLTGDVIEGQIVSKEGNMVNVSLGQNSLITALMDTNTDLPLGSNIVFSVKNNTEGNITLTPLMTNMNSTPTVSSALNAAGLIPNERNEQVVSSMIKEGLSISKDNLLDMVKNLNDIPIKDIPDGVVLSKLGITPTEDNITQYHAYLGYEHQINSAVDDLLQMVPEAMSEMVSEGNNLGALVFSSDIINILTNQGAMVPMDEEGSTLSEMNLPVSNILGGEELNELNDLLKGIGLPAEFTEEVDSGNVNLQDLLYVIKSNIDNKVEEYEAFEKQTNNNNQINGDSNNVGLDFLKALKQENTKQPEQIKPDDAAVSELIKSKVFNKLLKTSATNQWKITPEQVGEDKEVSKLYRRITEQTSRIIEVMNKNSKVDSPIAEASRELGKNINFMNELNHMFNYVQLPLKLSGNDAHGELYVYSNKKNLGSEDGTVSALLHLDMDNLGPTDVYVTMNSANHVNTHFYLPDDESLDLIAAHIDELNARIEKRGYNCTTEVSHRDDMTNIMQTIVDDNQSTTPISISSFDAKA